MYMFKSPIAVTEIFFSTLSAFISPAFYADVAKLSRNLCFNVLF